MKDLEGGVYPGGGGGSHYFVSSAFPCPTCPIFIYIFPCCPCGSRVSERSASPILLDLILRVKNCLVTAVIPYVMDNPNNLNFFDAIVKTNAELSLHPWTCSTRGSTLLVSNIIHVAIGSGSKTPLFVEGWKYLIQFDQFALVNHKSSDTMSEVPPFSSSSHRS